MDYFLSKMRTYKFACKYSLDELSTVLDTNVATAHRLITDKTGLNYPKRNVERRFHEVLEELRERPYTQFPSLFFPFIPKLTYIGFDGVSQTWKGFYGDSAPEYFNKTPREFIDGSSAAPSGVDLGHFMVPAYPSKINGYYCPSVQHSIIKQTPDGWEEVSSFYERSRPKSKQLFNISFNRHESVSLTKPPRKPRTVKH